MNRHLAVILRILFALLLVSAGAVASAGTGTCTALGGTEKDISGSGSCGATGSRTWYNDADSDGYYDATICCCPSGTDCDKSSDSVTGYASSGTYAALGTVNNADYDCDESSADVNPGQVEICDSANTDEDCDGNADDDDSSASSATKTTYYPDADGDTYGDDDASVSKCDKPSGYITTGGDCDDTSSAIKPSATEVCDSANTDEDCDGNADDNDSSVSSSGKSTWYRDADSDTYGSSATTTSKCDKPTGYVSNATDCNDSSSSINPAATEVCDSANTDEDCDSAADDNDTSVSSSGKTTYYLDSDGDGQGTSATTTSKCDVPTGYASSSTDCDDSDPLTYLGATEIVGDEIDESCNGKETCYIDTDGDGYRRDSGYSTTTTTSSDEDCNDSGEAVSTAPATDCDDLDEDVNPSATEIAGDNEDQNCDDVEECYYDADNDGYRLTTTFNSTDTDCNDSGEGLATDTAGDCDDTKSSINPGKTETVGDGVDQNCDDKETCYVDEDNDGYHITTTVESADEDCDDSGEALSSEPDDDCDDEDATVNPGATESANGVDDDCNGVTDDSTDARDLDGDCYCENTSICSSSVNASCTAFGTSDCDDSDDTVYPDADETNNGVDDDCDGIVDNGTKVYDDDGDCYCDNTSTTCTGSANSACVTVEPEDCNDRDDTINPEATDTWYDSYDDDCDGANDFDQDLDGYVPTAYEGTYTTVRGKSTVVDAATLPAGDCDDEDITINPDADEIWYDGIDEDCDALSDYDQDYDGYVANEYEDAETVDPGTGDVIESGDTTLPDDCDDEDDTVNPSVDEIWYDGYDQDCDDASDYDQDGDLYVDDAYADALTLSPGDGSTVEDGSTTESGDCDDEDITVNPSVDEIWYDGYDQNCDAGNDYDQDGDLYIPDAYESAVTLDPGSGDVVDAGTLPTGDCDDEDDSVGPSVDESWYDGVDQDCDEADDYDQDGDGAVYDEYVGLATYDPGSGDVVNEGSAIGGECDDEDPEVGPGEGETWYNGVDDDCQADDDYDQDGDGYVETAYVGLVTRDTDGVPVPGTGGLSGDDCDDEDATVNPDADETWYDGLDQNCDEASDFDQDADGFVLEGYEGYATYAPADCELKDGAPKTDSDCLLVEDGETLEPGDCIDSFDDLEDQYDLDESSGHDPYAINPDAHEDCDSTDPQVDDDCDGDVNTETTDDGEVLYAENGSGDVYYADADGDLFGDATSDGLYLCFVPDSGYSSTYGDCDDSNANRYPGAAEVCNAIDDNCDLQVDEASNLPENTGGDEASGCVNLYSDRDNDGYGSTDEDDRLCMCTDQTSDECGEGVEYNPEDGLCYTLDSSDCYDRDATIKPRAEGEPLVETIDGHDNDCDGYVPIVELDCDNDGSLPMLPQDLSGASGVTVSTELGLADCRGPDGVSQPDCCLNDSCADASVCDDIVSIDQSVTCWDGEEMRVICDAETGFIVVSRDYDTDGTHFQGGRRTYSNPACETDGDCDDLCASRCPDMEEVCDGMDNDCNGAEALIGDADEDGIPDSMDEDGVPNDHGVTGVVPGYVNQHELDLDGDGYLGCTLDDLVERSQTAVAYAGCSTSENLGDCNNTCYLSSPIAEEERCNGFLDVCGGESEGTDKDRDEFETCGAWGPEDGELAEDFYLLVYLPGLNADDTGAAETGATETGSAETGSAETGSADTGATDTGATETGAAETGAAETGGETGTGDTSILDTGATDTSSSDTGDSGAADTGVTPRPRRPFTVDRRRVMAAEDLDVDVLPLVLPRALAPECDQLLGTRLASVIGADALESSVASGSSGALLELCVKAEACRQRRAGAEPSWPDSCAGITGQCTVVRLTMDTTADAAFYDEEVQEALDADADCSAHPEQAIVRSVWSQERLTAARELVVQWECFRLDGTFGCGDLTPPDGWASPFPAGTLESGNFSNADPEDLLGQDKRWWKELTRFNPEPVLEGVLAGCWGDPDPGTRTVAEVISEHVGGDCADGENLSNRGMVEGPDDLLGEYLDPSAAGDCSLCLDGIDNNCNGLTDCAEPACARCFVGQGTGCGGGSESPCAQGGCSTGAKRRNATVDPSGLMLVGLALMSLCYRWRRKR